MKNVTICDLLQLIKKTNEEIITKYLKTMTNNSLNKTHKTEMKIFQNLGLFCLPLGILLSGISRTITRNLASSPNNDFVAGFFLGLSVVTIIAGIILTISFYKNKIELK